MHNTKLDPSIWSMTSNEAPGYLGARRDAKYAEWNNDYGQDNWRLGWLGPGEHTISFLNYVEACALYERSYVSLLLHQPLLLEQLVTTASDVYDDSPTNVASGLDYTAQETERTHIQDIAIRNALAKIGATLRGDELIQIRSRDGKSPLSLALSPGQVTFYDQGVIKIPSNYAEVVKRRWWIAGSVEDFWQMNKRLFVRR